MKCLLLNTFCFHINRTLPAYCTLAIALMLPLCGMSSLMIPKMQFLCRLWFANGSPTTSGKLTIHNTPWPLCYQPAISVDSDFHPFLLVFHVMEIKHYKSTQCIPENQGYCGSCMAIVCIPFHIHFLVFKVQATFLFVFLLNFASGLLWQRSGHPILLVAQDLKLRSGESLLVFKL